MQLLKEFIERAKQQKRRIVLPEGLEERTLTAADRALKDGIADIILIGEPEEVRAKAKDLRLTHIDNATIISPTKNEKKSAYATLLYELRKSKGMTMEEAEKLVEDPLFLACLMIKSGDADGEVAGAENTTGNVLRPALQIIKTKPGTRVVSGVFIIASHDRNHGKDGVLIIGDCAVIPNPTAEELAQIAVSAANTTKKLLDIEPRVAMLSFSTKGSGKHELVDKVAAATRMAQEQAPEFMIDGELQVDAALDIETGERKAPGSPVAGHANVLIFPDLQSGNISYKLAQRLGGVQAIGPILQGIAQPVNDLSRGCSVDDIYYLIAITSLQASEASVEK